MKRPVNGKMTRIAAKFQMTVPPEYRDLFDLKEGDLFEWNFIPETGDIRLTPKRAQLLTPQVANKMGDRRKVLIEQLATESVNQD